MMSSKITPSKPIAIPQVNSRRHDSYEIVATPTASFKAKLAEVPILRTILRWMPKQLSKDAESAIRRVCEKAKKGVLGFSKFLRPVFGDFPEDKDPQQSFISACKDVNDALRKLIDKPLSLLSLPEEQLVATYAQLENKEIIISTNGRHKCGKSTLLNALLYDSLLPMSLFNETGVQVKIEHADFLHRGACTNTEGCCWTCPRLAWEYHNTVQGRKDIYKTLKEANKISRQANGSEVKEYTLTANVPVLADVQPGWKISILDNPGFGESHQEDMMQRTEITLRVNSAFLYIMDAAQLQDKEDAHSLEIIQQHDRGAFDDKRFIVVVTQFDKTYDSEEQLSKEEIQKMVCSEIKAQTGKEISPEVVIPVCGKWAYQARQLRQNLANQNLRHEVISGLYKCPSAPGGEKENLPHVAPQMLADRLEDVTGICVLEQRIMNMSSECVQVWVDAISKKYHGYLTTAITEIDSSRRAADTYIRGLMESYEKIKEHCTTIERVKNILTQRIQDNSGVQLQLQEACKKDIEKTKEQAERMVEEFSTMCAEKIASRDGNFGPQEFEEAINELLKEKLTPRLYGEIDHQSSSYQCGRLALEDAISIVHRDVSRMRSEAEKYIDHEEDGDDTDRNSEEGNIHGTTERQGNDREVFNMQEHEFHCASIKDHVKIPELQLTFWEWLSKELRVIFSKMTFKLVSPPVTRYKSTDCIDEAIKELHTHVKKEVARYLHDAEQRVASYLFGQYCEHTKECLNSFEKDYRYKLKHQESNDEECLGLIRIDLHEQEQMRDHLVDLQARLNSRSQEYKRSLMSTNECS